jgi:lysyl-tRNA synthetase class I
MKENNWTFEEFALSAEMQNFYSQYFTSIKLSDFTFIGIYENLNYSIERCLSELDIKFDNIVPILNVTDNYESINLNPKLIKKIKKFHSKDYKIYEYAVNKFHRKNTFSILKYYFLKLV